MGACRHPETRNLTMMTVPWVRVGKTAFKPHSRLASRIRSLSFFSLAPIASRFRGLFISNPQPLFLLRSGLHPFQPPGNTHQKDDIFENQKRDAQDEIPFLSLMPEDQHTEPHSDTSECRRPKKQESLRNPLRSGRPTPMLVESHTQEGSRIHQKKNARQSESDLIHSGGTLTQALSSLSRAYYRPAEVVPRYRYRSSYREYILRPDKDRNHVRDKSPS